VPLEALVDNDVAIKGSCYDALAELVQQLGGPRSAGVLGTARFVVRRQLERNPAIHNRAAASVRWAAFLTDASELEPTGSEVDLATTIEEAAANAGLALDGGESQLCAIAISRAVPLLLTGDKRAIEAAELLTAQVSQLSELSNRVGCLEQIIEWLVLILGAAAVRERVCAEPKIDKAISICFSCASVVEIPNVDPQGLRSYINSVRAAASTLLRDGQLFN